MSTHNICFYGEMRKILYGYSLIPGAMFNICPSVMNVLNVLRDCLFVLLFFFL